MLKETARDASMSGSKLNQHQQLLAEIEARYEDYTRVQQLGQDLLPEMKTATKDVCNNNHVITGKQSYNNRIHQYLHKHS